jgi:putative ABC transport system ATP-binding protein
MNKFLFRRSSAAKAAERLPAPQDAAEAINPEGGDAKNGTPPGQEQKSNPQYTLNPEDGIPKTLTLTTSSSAAHTMLSGPTTANGVAASAAAPSNGSGKFNNGQPLIRLDSVVKAYQTPVGEFVALRGIDLSIGRGEFVAVVGKSGSGKSTLINMITGIDRPTSGEIFIGDTPIHNLAEGPMAEWRGRNIGIIFQFFQLLPMLSCIENVMLPMDFCNMFKPSEREARALHLLEQVDMVDHAYKLPSEVSGGQQQRVAIARALANDPPLLVADEPTGNLDSRSAVAVFQLFAHMVDSGKTILMVTHDDDMAHQVRRTITIADGQIVQQEYHERQAAEDRPTNETSGDQATVADPSAVSM